MKLVRPSVEILDNINGDEILKRLEQVARTCYKSEDKITESTDSAKKLLGTIMQVHHESILEFVDITVKFTCSRVTSQSIVRHRLGSYAQESTRYCNYSKDKFGNQLTFIIPKWSMLHQGEYTIDEVLENAEPRDCLFLENCKNSELMYNRLIKLGCRAEEARDVLPLCIKTEINVKYNLREWRHFFSLRCSDKAHPEIRLLARTLLSRFHDQIPVIFDDLYKKFILYADSTDSVQESKA